MPREKGTRSDSVNSQVAGFTAGDIQPPDHVNIPPEAMPFWTSLVHARAEEHWTRADLENAANLARTKAKIEKLNAEVEVEGDVIANKRGTPIPNPKHAIIETLTRRVIALSRIIHVHAAATSGDSRDEKKTSTAQRRTRKTREETDDLIPTIQ